MHTNYRLFVLTESDALILILSAGQHTRLCETVFARQSSHRTARKLAALPGFVLHCGTGRDLVDGRSAASQ